MVNENPNYITTELNQFMHDDCSKKMTVNNIDCVQYKKYYNSPNIIRIIESKHWNEGVPPTQFELLKELAEIFKNNKTGTKCECYIIRGDLPYDKVEITNLITAKVIICKDRERFIKFCNFEIGFEQLQNVILAS